MCSYTALFSRSIKWPVFPDEIFLSHKAHLHSFFWKGLEKCRIMLRNLETVEEIMLNVCLKFLYLYLEVAKLELNLRISLPALLHTFTLSSI